MSASLVGSEMCIRDRCDALYSLSPMVVRCGKCWLRASREELRQRPPAECMHVALLPRSFLFAPSSPPPCAAACQLAPA
eukprot:4581519-Alexandrium_andersonii.AAC.1